MICNFSRLWMLCGMGAFTFLQEFQSMSRNLGVFDNLNSGLHSLTLFCHS